MSASKLYSSLGQKPAIIFRQSSVSQQNFKIIDQKLSDRRTTEWQKIKHQRISISLTEKAKEFMNLNKDDTVIITGGFPNTGVKKTTNLMKIEII